MEAIVAKTEVRKDNLAYIDGYQIRPENAPLMDEEIQEEANIVRYGNKYGKPGRNWEEDIKRVEEIKNRICLK